MEEVRLPLNFWNDKVLDWNEEIRVQNAKIKEANDLIKASINKTKEYKKKYLPLKSVLISKQ